MNRFIINLRSFDSPNHDKSTTGIVIGNNLSDIQFRAPTGFLGNIGESLEIGLGNRDDYEEEINVINSNHEICEVRSHSLFHLKR